MIQLNRIAIQTVAPEFINLELARIYDDCGSPIGYHANALNLSGEAIGSGISHSKKTAQLIAVSETIERALVKRLANSDESKLFRLDDFPTSCGFAFGFSLEATKRRAIAEAAERWAWSKWIDEKQHISSPNMVQLSPIAKKLAASFDQIHFYESQLRIEVKSRTVTNARFSVAIGSDHGGVFPGSKVTYASENPWEHAITEAFRHKLIFNSTNAVNSSIVAGRINYSGENGEACMAQISSCGASEWSNASINFVKSLPIPEVNGYLVRAIADDYMSWDKGDETRFVY